MRQDDMEYRFHEFRADDGGIDAVVLRYGDRATIGSFTEEFRAGVFGDLGDVIANIQHQRAKPVARTGAGLELQDSAEMLKANLRLPDTAFGREARELIDAKILRGVSVEFRALEDEWQGNHRIVKRASLYGIALVDRPAYSDSQIAERWARDLKLREEPGRRYYY